MGLIMTIGASETVALRAGAQFNGATFITVKLKMPQIDAVD